MKKKLWFKLAVVSALVFLSGAFFVVNVDAQEKLPKLITMTSYPEGTAAYSWTAGFRQAIEKFSPMKIRVEAFGADIGRLLPLKTGDSELACVSGGAAFIFAQGLWDWKKYGPQPIKLVWAGWRTQVGTPVRGDSDIMTPADLKGKKIPFVPGGIAVSKSLEAVLAFGGLTWDDVKMVKVSSMRAQLAGILDGTVDTCFAVPFAPPIQALASGPHGVRWLPMPKNDIEGWKRAQAVAPWLRPDNVTVGPGLSKEKPGQIIGYPNGIWVYETLGEDIVYAVAKAMHLGYNVMKDMHPDLKRWSIDVALDLNWLPEIPYHDGTVKYFKEIGRWTPELEKWQQAQVKNQQKHLGR